mmetsp:Transcript_31709/g.47068  ORF Transcript_31709/g.47068 Transcript_31709/m.47068 type:complete len:93 (-) Transcript_31709:2010-2288(-)
MHGMKQDNDATRSESARKTGAHSPLPCNSLRRIPTFIRLSEQPSKTVLTPYYGRYQQTLQPNVRTPTFFEQTCLVSCERSKGIPIVVFLVGR